MSSSVTTFEDEVDQLIDTLVTSLETVLPTGVLRPVSDDTLLVTTGHLERLGRVVDARRVEAAGELHHRSRPTLGSASLAVRKGCRDAVELLRRVTLGSTATVRRRVKLGAETRVQVALSGDLFPPRFPHIATALHDGTLGVDAASAIVTELSPTLVRADVADVQRAEAELVAAATGTGPDSPVPCTAEEIRGQASVWRVFLDQDGTLPTEEKAMGRRMFSPGSYNSADGLVHGRYALMPEVHGRLGKVFDACLTPKTAPAFLPEGHQPVEEGASTGGITTGDVSTEPAPGPVDTRTPDQQRHDVFAAMIDGFARSGAAPTIGGASPTVLVQVTADTLESGHGAGFVSLGGLGGQTIPISLRAVHQMICTGGTQQVTLDRNGAIIELGSEQRCFTPNQRRAITLRDGGCIIPGCTIPAASTEIHHVTPDSEGGPTHTDNGVLLCWYHHRTITTSGWHIKMINKTPPPESTRLAARRRPMAPRQPITHPASRTTQTRTTRALQQTRTTTAREE
ncbi:HNH endonuclease signature motif containing protein [Homoserinimonas sp. A447]